MESLSTAVLAEAKHLPLAFLASLGITDFKYRGQASVRIPYFDENGSEAAVRFRISLSGDSRFRWRKGSKVLPYGLDRLDQAKRKGWVIVVEGESDCWTCWFYGIPAIGIPGKTVWSSAWKKHFDGFEVFVWEEPEAADFTARILKDIPDLRYIKAPAGIKDISEAHIQAIYIAPWLDKLRADAGYGRELLARNSNEALAKACGEARYILEAEDPLQLIENAIRELGYGGDLKPVLITYLAATSRVLEMRTGLMPVHLLLLGPSSSGKNYTLSRVLNLLPPEAFVTIDAGSPRSLIYNDAELAYRVLVYSEADSLPAGEDNPAASAIRSLLQDHRLSYEATERDPATGRFFVRKIEKPGPTTLITTSTKSLGNQMMSRLFILQISDSSEQIRAALIKQAELEEQPGSIIPDQRLISFQRYLQLKAPISVSIPFAKELALAIGGSAAATRILRDFARLRSLIRVVALVRQNHRKVDSAGRIVAEVTDYETVRDLINDMYVDSSTGVTPEVRELVENLSGLHAERVEGERITNTTLANKMGIGVKRVTRIARKAIKSGWVINREQRKSYPADYETGEPMPEAVGLPMLTGDDTAAVNRFSFENEGVDRLTG